MDKMRRITLDYDFKSPVKILYFLYKVFGLGFKQLIIKPSKKKGYHVFIWTNAKGKIFDLRYKLGDDKGRIYMDKTHKHARQTLFNKKRKFKKVVKNA